MSGNPGAETGQVAIRAMRLARNMSLNDLAAASGLSKGFLSKVERGLSSPPIATLMRIAEALDATVGELFDPRPPRSSQRAVLTRVDERDIIRRGREKGYIFERLAVDYVDV